MIRIGAKYGNVTASEIIPGRKTISKSTVAQIIIIKQVISSRLEDPIQRNAVGFTTDLWTDNVMQRSYLDVSFFWISQEMDHDSGIDKELWSLKRAMYACKVFPKTKTSENIEFELDQILTEVNCDPGNTPVTADKGANIVAATAQKFRLDCACHRINTAIKTGN